MAKPTILILGGAWNTGEFYEPFAKLFADLGYPTKCVGLASVGVEPPPKDASGDVAKFREAAKDLIEQKKDVIAILHSAGGVPGTDALHGLGKTSPEAAGVVALVYLATQLPKAGATFASHVQAVGDEAFGPARENFGKDGYFRIPEELIRAIVYDDLDGERAEQYLSQMQPQPMCLFDWQLQHETYHEIPSAYIICARERAFKLEFQQQTVADRGFKYHDTLDMGLTPWLIDPEKTRETILRVANQAMAQAA